MSNHTIEASVHLLHRVTVCAPTEADKNKPYRREDTVDEPSSWEEAAKQYMDRVPEVKTWSVPANSTQGPVTIELRVPEIKVTDSAGRFIVVSPKQASLVGSRLVDIDDWLQLGDRDWVRDDADNTDNADDD